MRSFSFLSALFLGSVAVLAPAAEAATLEVGTGAPYVTIQAAIDAATPGVDNVFVRCGLYTENLVLKSGVNVSGAGASCTIVDGSGAGSVVTAIDTNSSTVFERFTLRNGSAAQGGGVYIEAAALTLRHNVIEANSAIGATFPNGVGGGIHIQTDFNRAFTEPSIRGNVIRNNSAERFGGGISIDTDDGSTIADNIITSNSAGLLGGGINMFNSFPDLINNTIVRNCSQSGGPACTGGGGGVAITDSGVVDFHNNLIAWNEAAGGGGGIDSISSSFDFQSNDVFGNLPGNYSGLADPTGTAGNLSVDPLLIDEIPALSGHQPRSDSPLIDAGITGLVSALDIRGVPRALDGDGDGVATPDIGARENEGPTRLGFMSSSIVLWDPSVDPSAVWNLYRGELSVLKATGVYTQDNVTAPDSRQWCGVNVSNVSDMDTPSAGATWFYLAVVSAGVEGTLGFDSSLTSRPFTDPNRCP
jgi:hypothetical protein